MRSRRPARHFQRYMKVVVDHEREDKQWIRIPF